MRRSRRPIVIASRSSLLARAQAQAIGRALAQLHPSLGVEYRWIESEGDQRPDEALADAGGKGLFARAIERAVLSGDADVAVHSLKDLPSSPEETTAGLVLAAIPRRGEVRDCLVAHPSLGAGTIEQLPPGARVGTASPRRAAQLQRIRGDLKIELIRGNIDTRLRKVLEEKQYEATLMAAAGLIRAGLAQHATHLIDPAQMLPAASQGALALQCRADDHVSIWRCLPLNDPLTAEAVHAERRVVQKLEGDCHSAIAALAEPLSDGAAITFRLRVRVLSRDGQSCLEFDEQTSPKQMRRVVNRAIQQLQDQGCQALLQR